MARFVNPYPVQGVAIGFSWKDRDSTREHKDPRVRVHVKCLSENDAYDTVIVASPSEPRCRPRCSRCGHLIG